MGLLSQLHEYSPITLGSYFRGWLSSTSTSHIVCLFSALELELGVEVEGELVMFGRLMLEADTVEVDFLVEDLQDGVTRTC